MADRQSTLTTESRTPRNDGSTGPFSTRDEPIRQFSVEDMRAWADIFDADVDWQDTDPRGASPMAMAGYATAAQMLRFAAKAVEYALTLKGERDRAREIARHLWRQIDGSDVDQTALDMFTEMAPWATEGEVDRQWTPESMHGFTEQMIVESRFCRETGLTSSLADWNRWEAWVDAQLDNCPDDIKAWVDALPKGRD